MELSENLGDLTIVVGNVLTDEYNAFEKELQLPEPYRYETYICTKLEHDAKNYDTYWCHPDHLGSSNYITNLDGDVSQHMEYLPFGETLVEEHLNSYNSPYKLNGQILDAETGNYYLSQRYFSPKYNLMLSVDPMYEKYPSWSPYAYAMHRPTVLVDPTGMVAESPNNEYKIFRKNGEIQRVEYVSDKGGNETDYITEINLDKIPRTDAIKEYSVDVDVEYTSGPGNQYDQKNNPTPGNRKVHGKNHTDLVAYEYLLALFTGGETMTVSTILATQAKKQIANTSINQLNKLIKQNSKKIPRGIIRFDKGRGTKNLPHDEVHFKGGASLYRNGTWRHNTAHKLTNKQIKFLKSEGWTIPKQ